MMILLAVSFAAAVAAIAVSVIMGVEG